MTEQTTETQEATTPELPPVPEKEENKLAEDMTVEEVLPNLQAVAELSKGAKKIRKLAEQMVSRMNGRLNAERDMTRKKVSEGQDKINKFIQDFAKNTNANIQRFEKKYEEMYSYLVKQFLVNLEQRVFTNEIFTQGVLDVVIRRLYILDKHHYESTQEVPEGVDPEEFVPEEFMSYDDYVKQVAKEHETKMNEIANKIAKQQAAEAKAAKEAQGVKQSEDGAGSGEGSSDGAGSEVGQEADPEVDRTDDGTDSQDSEQPTEEAQD